METERLSVPEIDFSLLLEIHTPEAQSFFHGAALQQEKPGLVLEIRGYGKYMGESLPEKQLIQHGTAIQKDVSQEPAIVVHTFPVIFKNDAGIFQ